MEYPVLIYRDQTQDNEIDWSRLEADYVAYFEAAGDAGVLRGGPRLQPSNTASTVAVRDGKRLLTDGPFTEAREQLGGVFVLDCEDLNTALDWAAG
jgi:hypothetical protein